MLHFKIKKIISLFLLVFMFFAFSFSLVGAQDPDPNLGTSTLDWTATDNGGADAQTGGSPVVTVDPTTLTNTQGNQSGDIDTPGTYKLLEPLGTPNGSLTEFTTGDPCPFVRYLNIVIEIFLGICAVLAMIMIIGGGFEYMTSELPSAKGNGKARITNAVFGFIIALAGYVLLNTVNPKLLDLCPKLPQASLTVVNPNSINDKPITPGNIARCKEITDPSSPCNPQNLANYFGDKAADMSKICNVESGGNEAAESGSDVGTDGTVFSFGLFQINLLANGEYVGPECKGLFMTSSAGQTIPPAKYIQKDSAGKYHYDAMLKPGKEAQYNACKAKLLDPQTNLAIAKKLFDFDKMNITILGKDAGKTKIKLD